MAFNENNRIRNEEEDIGNFVMKRISWTKLWKNVRVTDKFQQLYQMLASNRIVHVENQRKSKP